MFHSKPFGKSLCMLSLSTSMGLMMIGVCGCEAINLIEFGLPDVPGEIQYVMNSKQQLAQSDLSALSDVKPGTYIGELDDLSGCWGSYDQWDLDVNNEFQKKLPWLPDTVALQPDVFEFYRFDLENNIFDFISYQRMYTPQVGILSRWYGNIVSYDKNHMFVELTHSQFSDPFSGALYTSDESDNPYALEYLITLEGSSMKLRAANEEDRDEPERENLVFRRIDCPEPTSLEGGIDIDDFAESIDENGV